MVAKSNNKKKKHQQIIFHSFTWKISYTFSNDVVNEAHRETELEESA